MSPTPSGLFDHPMLVLDPGMHTARITCADVDAAGEFAVTSSHDKTVRVWSLADGTLERTIRMPAGPENIGQGYAVAISPDGTTIAAGGHTRGTDQDRQEQIYIFDRASGAMTNRIDGLPNVVFHLAFSRDGARLAAVLGANGGLRLYGPSGDGLWTRVTAQLGRGWGPRFDGPAGKGRWQELARDTDYVDSSVGVAFAGDGRLATTSLDGQLRLYDVRGSLIRAIITPHANPLAVAFNPVDGRLAVGFDDSAVVLVYDGETLEALYFPDVVGIDNGNLAEVAWSENGAILFAGGTYNDGCYAVISWDAGGAGLRRALPAGDSTVASLRALRDGALLVAAQDPWLGVIEADGASRWAVAPRQMDPRGQMDSLAVSPDGMLLEFGQLYGGKAPLRFDVAAPQLLPPREDGRVLPPVQDGLAIADWLNSTAPTLDGVSLPLDPHEISRSLAIHPDGVRFLLGTEWSLRAFDAAGAELWKRDVPGVAWAVNITGDGKLAVAAYADGTVRWHRMEDGAELLAFYPVINGPNWAAWILEGIYAATPLAQNMLRWHVNHGWDAPAEAIPISDIPETHHPAVIGDVLMQLGTPGALPVAELAKVRGAVQRATGSETAPGARLHVLAIGVSDYGPAASQLDLAYADQDARDVASALRH